MCAAVIHAPSNNVDAIKIEHVPDPSPGPGEVLIEVRAAALNHLDIWVRRGGRSEVPMPHILGSDASGVVAGVGPGVQAPAVGDEVVVHAGLSCGRCEHCRRGQHSECVQFGIIGATRGGMYCERLVVPAGNCYPKPAHLNFVDAAAFPLTYVTAWRMLFTRAALLPGQTVLIQGIGGGVALAGLALAKLAGAEIIATSSSDEKLSRAKDLGADHGINYKTSADVAEEVLQFTDGRGVDVVFDAVGGATLATNVRAVRRGGRIVLCAITGGAAAELDLRAVYWNQLSLLGSTSGSDEDFRQMLRAVEANALEPVIDSVYLLKDVVAATARMERGEQFGKIVLNIAGE